MEALVRVGYWFFTSVYGIGLVAAVTFFILNGLRGRREGDHVPAMVAVAIVVLGMTTLPSIPRYAFEDQIMATIQDKPWVKVVNKTKIGTLIEPLTWFNAPVGSISVVTPGDALTPGFHMVIFSYGQKEVAALVEPDCATRMIDYSYAGEDGIYRADEQFWNQRMSDKDYELYCKTDWTEARRQVNAARLAR